MIINPEQIFELQNKVLEQANNSYDRITNLLYWTVGTFLAIAGILAFLQFKMSEKQINKLRGEIESDLNEKYKLDTILKLSKDVQYTYMSKALDDMSENIKNKSFSMAMLNFRQSLEYVDVTDEKFVNSLIISGHMGLYISSLNKDDDFLSKFEGKEHNHLWKVRIDILKEYDKVLDKIEIEETNKTNFKTTKECKQDLNIIMKALYQIS